MSRGGIRAAKLVALDWYALSPVAPRSQLRTYSLEIPRPQARDITALWRCLPHVNLAASANRVPI